MAGCFLGAAAATYHHLWWSDEVKVDESALSFSHHWFVLVMFGLFAAPAALLYLKAHAGAAMIPARTLRRDALLMHLAAAAAMPLTSNDAFSNLAYGRMMTQGLNPYLDGPASLASSDPFTTYVGLLWFKTPIVYGPLAAWPDALAAATGDPVLALFAFKAIVALASIGIVLVAWRLCAPRDGDPASKRDFVFIAWNPILIWELAAQAHNDAFMVLGMVAFIHFARRDQVYAAVTMLVVAFCAKFAVLPLIGLYGIALLRRSWPQALAAAALFAVGTMLLFAPFWAGPATLAAPLHAMVGDPERHTRSFFALFRVMFQSDPDAYWLAWGWQQLGTAALVAAAVYAVGRTRTIDDVCEHSLRFFLVYLLVAATWCLPWYATWAIPLALSPRDARWQRLLAVYSALLLVQYAVPKDPWTYPLVNGIPMVMAWRIWREGRSAPAPAPALSAA
jgi:hypothetical protein